MRQFIITYFLQIFYNNIYSSRLFRREKKKIEFSHVDVHTHMWGFNTSAGAKHTLSIIIIAFYGYKELWNCGDGGGVVVGVFFFFYFLVLTYTHNNKRNIPKTTRTHPFFFFFFFTRAVQLAIILFSHESLLSISPHTQTPLYILLRIRILVRFSLSFSVYIFSRRRRARARTYSRLSFLYTRRPGYPTTATATVYRHRYHRVSKT